VCSPLSKSSLNRIVKLESDNAQVEQPRLGDIRIYLSIYTDVAGPNVCFVFEHGRFESVRIAGRNSPTICGFISHRPHYPTGSDHTIVDERAHPSLLCVVSKASDIYYYPVPCRHALRILEEDLESFDENRYVILEFVKYKVQINGSWLRRITA
jgi:hypothetical protein